MSLTLRGLVAEVAVLGVVAAAATVEPIRLVIASIGLVVVGLVGAKFLLFNFRFGERFSNGAFTGPPHKQNKNTGNLTKKIV